MSNAYAAGSCLPHIFIYGKLYPLARVKDLKRSDSLKRKKEFRYTYRVGKSVSDRFMTLIFARSRKPGTKVGFSVSKKIGNAVHRNRCKRRLREAVTPLLSELKSGYNIIYIPRIVTLTAPFPSLVTSVRKLAEKAKLLKETAVDSGSKAE